MDVASILGGDALRADLTKVESRLLDACCCDHQFLSEIVAVLASAGGKRLRPALVLAVGAGADVAARADPDVVTAAVSVELLHLGSLYHDDVIDEADTRRGTASANARAGNILAVLAGDVLLARSIVLAASIGERPASIVAGTLDRLCQGQALETDSLYDPHRAIEDYAQAIDGKTAALLAACCELGGVVGGFGERTVAALQRYGRHLGVAFQLADDVLDLVAPAELLGKPTGNDVAEGVYTLPVLLARDLDPSIVDLLAEADPKRRAVLVGQRVAELDTVGVALEQGEQEAEWAAAALSEADDLSEQRCEQLRRLADEIVATARTMAGSVGVRPVS